VLYDPESLDLTSVSIVVRSHPGSKLEDVEASVRAELNAIASGDVAEADLTHAKRDLIAKAAISVDKMPAAARLVGEALAHNRTLQDVQNWWRKVDAVGIGEVSQAATSLMSAPSVTGLLVDSTSGAADSLQLRK
jgi:predicted Zn-dependent peptidase